jgi:hypothetical protein
MEPFPKIFHIGEGYIPHLLDGNVEVSEKIDGSQFCFGLDSEGEFTCRSKGRDLTYQPERDQFVAAYDIAYSATSELKPLRNIYFYCEFLSKPRHNILKYDRVPKNGLYLFGMRIGMNYISDWHTLTEWAEKLKIEPPNVLYCGTINTTTELKEMLERHSILGGTIVEGIVVKNYNEPVVMGHYTLPVSMGKWVRGDFKERNSKEFHTDKDELTAFIDSFRTQARWNKAIQHFKDDGKLLSAPQDIGPLMGEIARDLLEEETEQIKNELFKMFKRRICQRAQAGFAEYYKELLVEGVRDG